MASGRDVRTRPSLAAALGLTLASTLLWGIAHLYMGRRAAGALLAIVFVALTGTVAVIATTYRQEIAPLAVQSNWLTGFTIGAIGFALVWIGVVIRSYQITRPAQLTTAQRVAGLAAVTVLCAAICTPLGYAARLGDTARSTLSSIFPIGGGAINQDDPFKGRRRLNIALLASDNAYNRTGTRTDSMTVASVDTRTGETVLLGIPRNLEHFPMPAGPARERFPDGFTGDGPQSPGILNEVFDYAETHPEIMPGVPAGRRGPLLATQTISGIIGQRIDYYILIDMFGFADVVDAMGGVRIKIVDPIPYGLEGAALQPGDQVLTGRQALWYGRSRNDTDDYTRMGRQKCLLRALSRQANPAKVLSKFEQLATATQRAIATDIPRDLLPALIKLSAKSKAGAKISNISFVPPLIHTGSPDFTLIRSLTAMAVGDPKATPGPATPGTGGTASPGPAAAHPSPPYSGIDNSGWEAQGQATPVSLDAACPS